MKFTFTCDDQQVGRVVTVKQDDAPNLATVIDAFESFLIASGFNAEAVRAELGSEPANESGGGQS